MTNLWNIKVLVVLSPRSWIIIDCPTPSLKSPSHVDQDRWNYLRNHGEVPHLRQVGGLKKLGKFLSGSLKTWNSTTTDKNSKNNVETLVKQMQTLKICCIVSLSHLTLGGGCWGSWRKLKIKQKHRMDLENSNWVKVMGLHLWELFAVTGRFVTILPSWDCWRELCQMYLYYIYIHKYVPILSKLLSKRSNRHVADADYN